MTLVGNRCSARGATSDYVLGHSADEQRRLDAQGAQLRPYTESLLREAGVEAGMRVLDAGCGTGDMSILAAELVGRTGHVLGVDRSVDVLGTATSRVEARGWTSRVNFVPADFVEAAIPGGPFDAVIGRNVLMHQQDPITAIRRLAALIRPGGKIVFAEPVLLTPPLVAAAERPLAAKCMLWLVNAFQGAGLCTDVGLRLYALFRTAGLPAPAVRLDGVMLGGADEGGLAWMAATVRSMQPVIARLGIATASEVEIDTLVERLVAEAETAGGALCGYLQGTAWVTVP